MRENSLTARMLQPSATPARIPSSTARRLSTGSVPGRPRQYGTTWVLGCSTSKVAGALEKILVVVESCAWTSRPITGSQRPRTSSSVAIGRDVARREPGRRASRPRCAGVGQESSSDSRRRQFFMARAKNTLIKGSTTGAASGEVRVK